MISWYFLTKNMCSSNFRLSSQSSPNARPGNLLRSTSKTSKRLLLITLSELSTKANQSSFDRCNPATARCCNDLLGSLQPRTSMLVTQGAEAKHVERCEPSSESSSQSTRLHPVMLGESWRASQ